MEERYKAVAEQEAILETRISNQQSVEDEFYRVRPRTSSEWLMGGVSR